MKTEIFGTFGPACASEEILKQMMESGMTGMRLNLSHTTLKESESYIRNYQKVAKYIDVKPQILIDMQGPELRVGKMECPLQLQTKDKVLLCGGSLNEVRYSAQIPIPAKVLEEIAAEDEILLDDGKILLRVKEVCNENNVWAEVIRGGLLQSNKSVKVVGKNINLPALTDHDIANLKVAKTYGVTALMQPFVLDGAQLKEVRAALKQFGAEQVRIFAKIENRLGVENIESILPEADVIIIARGDLGNDMPLWELPAVQKKIEAACKKEGKPYVVVTQMLASMEKNPVPTRAEVSDIYHAVYHGAWGIMLTGETAVGKYPVEAIRYMANTAAVAEDEKI